MVMVVGRLYVGSRQSAACSAPLSSTVNELSCQHTQARINTNWLTRVPYDIF
jgi:hypothetical protein